MFTLSEKSKKKLEGVHPHLCGVVRRAIEISKIDFAVIDGVRTYEKQLEYFKSGASKTMNSRHLKGRTGYSCAVDLAAFVDGKISWKSKDYAPIALAMKTAAKQFDVKIEWGGDWKTFVDMPHFQLPVSVYPQ